jgi:hypothetical protein
MKSVTANPSEHEGRRRSLVVLLALLLCTPALALAQVYPVPYVQFPFDITREGSSLERKFKVVEDRIYQFDLRFEFADRAEQDRVTEAVGNGPPDRRYGISGTIVAIRFKIISEANNAGPQPVFEGIVDTEGMHSMRLARQVGAGAFMRTIANVRLSPGLYRFQANTIRDTPSFSGITTQFAIGYDARVRPFR